MKRSAFTNPILTDDNLQIIAVTVGLKQPNFSG